MRIQSNFKDYYDVGMSQGQDLTLVYRRYTKEVKLTYNPFSVYTPQKGFTSFHGYNSSHPYTYSRDISQITVGFCGKVYSVITLFIPREEGKFYSLKEERAREVFCYSLEDIDNFIKKHQPKDWDDYNSKGYNKKFGWRNKLRREDYAKFFEAFEKNNDRHNEWFENERCPVFVARLENKEIIITYNACLKDLEFFRVFEPYKAFQEIAMWLGNQAEPRKPIPHIDDLTLSEAKGFDKFSFRKDKST